MAQDSLKIVEANRAMPFNKKKVFIVSSAVLVSYATSLVALNQTWYKNYPKTSFHTFNDSGEWLQMDKVGHSWSAYNLSRASSYAWQWTGLSARRSVLIGSITGFSYLTVIEFL